MWNVFGCLQKAQTAYSNEPPEMKYYHNLGIYVCRESAAIICERWTIDVLNLSKNMHYTFKLYDIFSFIFN